MPSQAVARIAAHVETCTECQRRLEAVDSSHDDPVLSALRRGESQDQTRPIARSVTAPAAEERADDSARPSLLLNPRYSGGASRLREEVRDLLRRRLRAMAWVGTFTWIWFLLMQAGGLNDSVTAQTQAVGARIMLGGLVVYAASGVLLWRRRDLPGGALRTIELLLMGVMVVYSGYYRYVALNRVPTASSDPAELQLRVEHATLLSNLYVLLTIISYGVYIPNTWRRCVGVVAGMAAVPIAINLYVGLHHAGVRSQLPMVLAVTLIGLFLAGSIAVFGSFRISTLQREAVEARQLGQYRLTRRIGAGGMGEVYLAEHRLLKRPCAVKVIRAERAGDPAVLRRFEREVRATARLTHPNTVEIYDYGHADDGTFYYVMEYLDGPNLEQVVKRFGPQSPARVVHLLRQICGALREAHGAGLIHRDIKPSNVIVCALGGAPDRVKLLDFGLVREAVNTGQTALTMPELALGTPDFMSPEQATGADRVDGRSDLYSVGALGYYMLTGRPPFIASDAIKVLFAHAYEAVRPPSEVRAGIPAELDRVLMRCLAKRPDDRFADAAALDAALAASASGAWTDQDAASWWRAHILDRQDQADLEPGSPAPTGGSDGLQVRLPSAAGE
jgi:serine/threonine-protein kinase